MYTFIALLIAILQDGQSQEAFMDRLTQQVVEESRAVAHALRTSAREKPARHIVPPCPCCYTPSRVSSVAAAWLNQCRLLAMQFVIMKPTLTVLPYVITLCGYDYQAPEHAPLLGDGRHVNWASAKLYVVAGMNISVALAFYGLLRFYHGTERELQWCDPWPKFLCIKGVVFMTFWQGICIQV